MSRPDDDPIALRLLASGIGPVPNFSPAPVPEPVLAPLPEPFAMSWVELRDEILRHSAAGRQLLALPPRDRPWSMADGRQLMRVETLVVELRRRSGRDHRRLPGVPDGFISLTDLSALLAPHRALLCGPEPHPPG